MSHSASAPPGAPTARSTPRVPCPANLRPIEPDRDLSERRAGFDLDGGTPQPLAAVGVPVDRERLRVLRRVGQRHRHRLIDVERVAVVDVEREHRAGGALAIGNGAHLDDGPARADAELGVAHRPGLRDPWLGPRHDFHIARLAAVTGEPRRVEERGRQRQGEGEAGAGRAWPPDPVRALGRHAPPRMAPRRRGSDGRRGDRDLRLDCPARRPRR